MTDKDLPPWIRLHVSMPDELADLSDRAFRLTIRLWCYCYRTGQFGTDGLVPKAILEEYARGSRAVITELKAADIIESHGSGVLCRSYLKWQESSEDRADLHAKRQAAGAKGGRRKAERLASATASATASAEASAIASALAKPLAKRKQSSSKNVAEVEREKEKEQTQDLKPNYTAAAANAGTIAQARGNGYAAHVAKTRGIA